MIASYSFFLLVFAVLFTPLLAKFGNLRPQSHLHRDGTSPITLQDRPPQTRASESWAAAMKGSIPPHLVVRTGFPDVKINLSARRLADSVFGTDDRIFFQDTSYPYRTVGLISSESKMCTGTMIGPRHVLTATHCISQDEVMTFTPSYYDGDAPYGSANVIDYFYWEDVIQNMWVEDMTDYEAAFDIAVLILDQRMGDVVGWMGHNDFDNSWIGLPFWYHIGYPGDNSRPVFSSDGVIWNVDEYTDGGVTGKVLGTFIDIASGHSGGPLYSYWDDEEIPRVVGVMSTFSYTPSLGTDGDNQAAGGEALLDMVAYALNFYP